MKVKLYEAKDCYSKLSYQLHVAVFFQYLTVNYLILASLVLQQPMPRNSNYKNMPLYNVPCYLNQIPTQHTLLRFVLIEYSHISVQLHRTSLPLGHRNFSLFKWNFLSLYMLQLFLLDAVIKIADEEQKRSNSSSRLFPKYVVLQWNSSVTIVHD